jgi:hypothetical protein
MSPNNTLNKISLFVLIYFSLKVIIFPIFQTGINITSNLIHQEKISIDDIKIPDITFPDITLIGIIFLFQPQTAETLKSFKETFKSFKVSPQGLEADFKDLQHEVEKNKEEIDHLQQSQIDEINKLQQFMYRLLLTPKEIEKLEGLMNKTLTTFYVSESASTELRRLRDSLLIEILPPNRYISDLEKLSDYGRVSIDLTQFCTITESGKDFLQTLEKMSNANSSIN